MAVDRASAMHVIKQLLKSGTTFAPSGALTISAPTVTTTIN